MEKTKQNNYLKPQKTLKSLLKIDQVSWLENRTFVVHVASSKKNPFSPNPEMFKCILIVLITLRVLFSKIGSI